MPIIDHTTVGLLSLALDATAMRHQAIAQNIANANTPGYQRVTVNFEQHLAGLRDTLRRGAAPSLANPAAYRPMLEAAAPGQETVALESEMAALSENTLHQQALLKALNKHIAIIGMAVNEGKR